jgi:hypothetical protein
LASRIWSFRRPLNQQHHRAACGTRNGQIDALLLSSRRFAQLPSQRIIKPANAAAIQQAVASFAPACRLKQSGMGVLCNNGSVFQRRILAGHACWSALESGRRQVCRQRPVANATLNTFSPAASVSAIARRASSTAIGSSAADLICSRLLGSTPPPSTRNASLIGQVSLGTQSWLSIGGTLARSPDSH